MARSIVRIAVAFALTGCSHAARPTELPTGATHAAVIEPAAEAEPEREVESGEAASSADPGGNLSSVEFAGETENVADLDDGSSASRPLSESELSGIKKAIIEESIAAYDGNCPCPYHTMRNGRQCGKNSAHSRDGGEAPLCYERDVTREMVDAHLAGQR